MIHRITRTELLQAQLALFGAILLQVVAHRISSDFVPGFHYIVIIIEIVLAVLLGFTSNIHKAHDKGIHGALAVILLGLMSFANVSSLIFVLQTLITQHVGVNGAELLTAAIAIFITNIIVYALWYWEIDSPGLTRTRWSKFDKDFQFVQQDMKQEFPDWQPQFNDYLYLSITNAVNFAPADTRPLTHQAKALMASQALVSVFTLALVIARSVWYLGS